MNGMLVDVAPRDDAEVPRVVAIGVALALDGQIAQSRGVEVLGIGREARRGRVLDALVDGEDGEIARSPRRPWLYSVPRLRSTVGDRSLK